MPLAALLACIAFFGAGATPSITFRTEAVAHAPLVTVADVARLDALPTAARARIGAVTVTAFRRGQAALRLDHARIAERIRAAMPAARAWLPGDNEGEVTVRLERPSAAPVAPDRVRACVEVPAGLAAGAVPVRDDLIEAACPDAAVSAFRHDPVARTVRARRDVAAGEIVLAPPMAMVPDLAPGDPLYLRARIGPVTVQREVSAAQPGWFGGSVFVRTAEGALVSATAEAKR